MPSTSKTKESPDPSIGSNSSGPDSAPDTINALDYLEILVRQKGLIIKTTLGAFVLSVTISLLLPNIYTATALVLPPQQSNGALGMLMGQLPGGMASLAGDLLGKTTSSDLYVRMLTSDAMSDTIIDRYKLMEVYKQDYRVDT
jgi:tyrosine-protein kinase Etk/Wzc